MIWVSLRIRLLAGMLVLVSAALVVGAVAIYVEQRSFLSGRLDQRVIAAATPISYQLGVDARLLERPDAGDARARDARVPALGKGLAGFLPSGTYGALIGTSGRIVRGPVTVNYGEARLSPPAFPARFPARFPVSSPGTTPELFTVDSKRGTSLRYRAAALALASGNGTIIVAVPSREIDQALDRLVVVETVVVAILILVLVALGWIVIRVGLRPLDEMGRVASEIADGNLSRRVRPATSRTEVGRLGLSLNKMLVRIEEAFADRANSEERHRQFLSDASHELRTPLASIRGYAELFRLGPGQDPAALERAMARIESEATRMGVLVEDLLLLARRDEMPDARRVPVNLSELCAHAAADARALAPAREVSFHADDELEVLADPGALRQVLANLMGNAVIHTPDGTPVELSVRREGGDAVLEVRDHGSGLPADAGDRVFERFWRAEGGRARGRRGAGLGLSIVREIVNSHHGTVYANSHPGGGAVFTVRVPAAPRKSGSVDTESQPGRSVSVSANA
jgi:two-component system OmpR family sensor kinase